MTEEPNIISKIRKTNLHVVSVAESLVCLYDHVLGKTVRTHLEVNYEGTIYGRKKEGVVQEICIKHSDIYCNVLFQWRQKSSTFGQYLWIPFDHLEFLMEEFEQGLEIFDLQENDVENSKIIMPYYYGQKVKTNPKYSQPYTSPPRYYEKQTGYIYEMSPCGNSFKYSLILVDEKDEFSGAQAWYDHEGLISLENATENSIKKMRQLIRRMEWE